MHATLNLNVKWLINQNNKLYHLYLQKAPGKNIRRRRSKIEGPIWDVLNPSEITAPRRLSRPTKVNMLQQILHQDFWLTSDIIDLASYILAKDNVHIDGFQSVLPFSAIANGGIVGTPQNKFVQILHIRQNHWITVSNLFCGENQLSVYDSKSAPLDPTDTVLDGKATVRTFLCSPTSCAAAIQSKQLWCVFSSICICSMQGSSTRAMHV